MHLKYYYIYTVLFLLVFFIDGDFIYWYDSSEKAIYRANKDDGSNATIFAAGIVNLTDFTIGHRSSSRKYLLYFVRNCINEVFVICSKNNNMFWTITPL